MSHKVIIGLNPDADLLLVKDKLNALGVEHVSDPSLSLPDVIVVMLSADTDIQEFLRAAQKIPGVRYAEADAWRSTF